MLRLRSASRDDLLAAAVHVIDAWRAWTDESVGVIALDEDGTRHNTVTPVVRRVDEGGAVGGERYEAYLALRCNVTSDEHPLGIFHPHAEYHHIKKENIGLIEVMGLAILPPRLVGELAAVRAHLLDGVSAGADVDAVRAALDADPASASHAAWAAEVYGRRAGELTEEAAEQVLRDEVGAVFGHVLEDAGVSSGTKPAAPRRCDSSRACRSVLPAFRHRTAGAGRKRDRPLLSNPHLMANPGSPRALDEARPNTRSSDGKSREQARTRWQTPRASPHLAPPRIECGPQRTGCEHSMADAG